MRTGARPVEGYTEARELSVQFQPDADNGELVGRLADLRGCKHNVAMEQG
jgi:hypothetical protein